MTLPNLELKFNKTTEKHDSNINTNTLSNTNSNTIIFNGQTTSTHQEPTSTNDLPHSSSALSLSRSDTPLNIKQFKDTLMTILISYFKNNIILLNNLVELSEKIITKLSDLTLLIALLLDIPQDKVQIDVEEIAGSGCCGKICKHLPRYRKIIDIVIDKKQSFRVSHNQFYVQLQTEYNISLDYVLI
jgi:hypothetical protein